MFALLTVSLAIVALTKAQLMLGYGVRVNPSDDSSACLVEFDIPSSVAGDDCEVEIYVDEPVGGVKPYTVFMKNAIDLAGPNADFLPADAATKKNIAGRWSAPCRFAGSYVVGVTVDSIAVGGVGDNLLGADDLAVMIMKGGNYVIDAERQMRTAPLILSEGKWALFNIELANTATPHFDIDSSLGSRADNYEYYIAKDGEDISTFPNDENSDSLELTGDFTSDVTPGELQPGKYTFGVYVKSIASVATIGSTTFRVSYDLNRLAKNVKDWQEIPCPESNCAAAEAQSCATCTEESCLWCESTGSCGNRGSTCPEAVVSDEDQCEDLEATCLALGSCSACLTDKRCLWCERTGASDICSPGKNNLGQECDSLLFPNSIKEVAQCPDILQAAQEAREKQCQSYTDCTSCVEDPACEYCDRPLGDACVAKDDLEESADETCEIAGVSVGSTPILAADKCPDVIEAAEKAAEMLVETRKATCEMKSDCTACVQDPGCSYCARPLGDACVGKDDLTETDEETCKIAGVSVGSTPVAQVEQCPDVLEAKKQAEQALKDSKQSSCELLDTCFKCSETAGCTWCDSAVSGSCNAVHDGEEPKDACNVISSPILSQEECPHVKSCSEYDLDCEKCAADDDCAFCDSYPDTKCMAKEALVDEKCPNDVDTITQESLLADEPKFCPAYCNAKGVTNCQDCLRIKQRDEEGNMSEDLNAPSACVWDTTANSCHRITANSTEEVVDTYAKCPSNEEFCNKLTSCGSCLEARDRNCMWCSPVTGESKCTTGEDGLGESCDGLLDTATTDCNDCLEPLSTCSVTSGSTLILSVISIVVALFAISF